MEPPRLSLQLLGREIPSGNSKLNEFFKSRDTYGVTPTVGTSQGDNRRCKTVSRRPIARTIQQK